MNAHDAAIRRLVARGYTKEQATAAARAAATYDFLVHGKTSTKRLVWLGVGLLAAARRLEFRVIEGGSQKRTKGGAR